MWGMQGLAQKSLSFQVWDAYEYVMKVDEAGQKLLRSSDPDLVPWLPQNQFGWHIQDQNYFDLFFEHRDGTGRKTHINFYEKLVLAIVTYDLYPWEVQVEAVDYYPRRHHIHLTYTGTPQLHRSAERQTTTRLVLVEPHRKLQKEGHRSLTFSVERLGDQPELLFDQPEENFKVFPLAYTASQLSERMRRQLPIDHFVQQPASASEEQLANWNREQEAERRDALERERAAREAEIRRRRQQQLAEAEEFAQKAEEDPATPSEAEAKQQELAAAREKALALRRKELAEAAPQPQPGAEENLAPSALPPGAPPRMYAYETPSGYTVRRDIQLDPVTYLVIRSKAEWDMYLKAVPPGMTTITPISDADFVDQIGLAVIKRGNAYWEMEAESMEQVGDELRVYYRAELTRENLGWEANMLFVNLVARGRYKKVSFWQNGERVETISLP